MSKGFQNKYFNKLLKKAIIWLILVVFNVTTLMPVPAFSQTVLSWDKLLTLPVPGSLVPLSQPFAPCLIKGIKVFPENPFNFDFIVDMGQTNLTYKDAKLNEEVMKMVKYFLASLTTPEDDLWVNLSPDEPDRIIPKDFGETEMGRDLLAQDYILKQITSSLMYPEGETGKKFWKNIYKKAYEKYGTTDVPVDSFNKVWIIPDKAVIASDGEKAFIVESRLKVMLEEEYLSLKTSAKNNERKSSSSMSSFAKEIIREIIIPELEKEVNSGESFTLLRQIYHAMILSTWFKQNIKESILSKVYVDKKKVGGLEIEKAQIDTEKIYKQYLEAFKKGAYNYIKEEYDVSSKSLIPRKYFSGGVNWGAIKGVQRQIKFSDADPAMISNKNDNLAQVSVSVDSAMVALTQKSIDGILGKDKGVFNFLVERGFVYEIEKTGQFTVEHTISPEAIETVLKDKYRKDTELILNVLFPGRLIKLETVERARIFTETEINSVTENGDVFERLKKEGYLQESGNAGYVINSEKAIKDVVDFLKPYGRKNANAILSVMFLPRSNKAFSLKSMTLFALGVFFVGMMINSMSPGNTSNNAHAVIQDSTAVKYHVPQELLGRNLEEKINSNLEVKQLFDLLEKYTPEGRDAILGFNLREDIFARNYIAVEVLAKIKENPEEWRNLQESLRTKNIEKNELERLLSLIEAVKAKIEQEKSLVVVSGVNTPWTVFLNGEDISRADLVYNVGFSPETNERNMERMKEMFPNSQVFITKEMAKQEVLEIISSSKGYLYWGTHASSIELFLDRWAREEDEENKTLYVQEFAEALAKSDLEFVVMDGCETGSFIDNVMTYMNDNNFKGPIMISSTTGRQQSYPGKEGPISNMAWGRNEGFNGDYGIDLLKIAFDLSKSEGRVGNITLGDILKAHFELCKISIPLQRFHQTIHIRGSATSQDGTRQEVSLSIVPGEENVHTNFNPELLSGLLGSLVFSRIGKKQEKKDSTEGGGKLGEEESKKILEKIQQGQTITSIEHAGLMGFLRGLGQEKLKQFVVAYNGYKYQEKIAGNKNERKRGLTPNQNIVSFISFVAGGRKNVRIKNPIEFKVDENISYDFDAHEAWVGNKPLKVLDEKKPKIFSDDKMVYRLYSNSNSEEFIRSTINNFISVAQKGLGPKIFDYGKTKEGHYFIKTDLITGENVRTFAQEKGRITGENLYMFKEFLERLIDKKVFIFDFAPSQFVIGKDFSSQENIWLVDSEYLIDTKDMSKADVARKVKESILEKTARWDRYIDQEEVIRFLDEKINKLINDNSMVKQAPGGIDLNPKNLTIENRGEKIKFEMPNNLEDFQNINGFVPHIIQIVPLVNLPAFLGMIEKFSSKEETLAKI